MMGVMENEINDVKIERYRVPNEAKSMVEAMDKYDSDVFKPVNKDSDSKVTRELSSSPEQSTINSKTGTPKENSKPLSLIWNNRTSLLPNSSTARIDVSTTNSSVLGTVANSGKDVSALSSLYTLNKTSADKSVVHAPSIRADSRKGVKRKC